MPFLLVRYCALVIVIGLVRLWVIVGKFRKNLLKWFPFCSFFDNSGQDILIIQFHKLIRIPHSIKELYKILLRNDNRPRVVIGMEA